MTKCWLCREPLETQTGFNYRCPSCLVDVNVDGSKGDDPGTINVAIALARSVDRLTKQLAANEENEKLARIAKKLGFP